MEKEKGNLSIKYVQGLKICIKNNHRPSGGGTKSSPDGEAASPILGETNSSLEAREAISSNWAGKSMPAQQNRSLPSTKVRSLKKRKKNKSKLTYRKKGPRCKPMTAAIPSAWETTCSSSLEARETIASNMAGQNMPQNNIRSSPSTKVKSLKMKKTKSKSADKKKKRHCKPMTCPVSPVQKSVPMKMDLRKERKRKLEEEYHYHELPAATEDDMYYPYQPPAATNDPANLKKSPESKLSADACTQTLSVDNLVRQVLISKVADGLQDKGLQLIACAHTRGLNLTDITNDIINNHTETCAQRNQDEGISVVPLQGDWLQDMFEPQIRPNVATEKSVKKLKRMSQICEFCPKKYFRVTSKHDHMKIAHRAICTSKTRKCLVCDIKFSNRDELVEHMEDHHGQENMNFPVKCKYCIRGFANKKSLIQHLAVHKPFACDLCSKSFNLKQGLKAHKILVHQKTFPFSCNICGKGTSSKVGLKVHKTLVHETTFPFSCNICGKGINCLAKLAAHKDAHLKVHDSDKCKDCISGECNLKRHLDIDEKHLHEKPKKFFKCHFCVKTFASRNSNRYHMKQYHKAICTSNVKTCLKCNLTFIDKSILVEHINNDHQQLPTHQPEGISGQEKLDVDEDMDQSVKCKYCAKSFACESDKCDYCPQSFALDSSLSHHLKKMHGDVENCTIKCFYCDIRFDGLKDFVKHVKDRHNERSFEIIKCDFCPAIFSDPEIRNAHMRKVHKALCSFRAKKCFQCDLEFGKWETLVEHMKVCHNLTLPSHFKLSQDEYEANEHDNGDNKSNETKKGSKFNVTEKGYITVQASHVSKEDVFASNMKRKIHESSQLSGTKHQKLSNDQDKIIKDHACGELVHIKCVTQTEKASKHVSAQKDHPVISPHVQEPGVCKDDIQFSIQQKRCWICGKRTNEWSDLLKHFSEEHKGQMPPGKQVVQRDETSRWSSAEKDLTTGKFAQKDMPSTCSHSAKNEPSTSQSAHESSKAAGQTSAQNDPTTSQSVPQNSQAVSQTSAHKDLSPTNQAAHKVQTTDQSPAQKHQITSESFAQKDTTISQSAPGNDQATNQLSHHEDHVTVELTALKDHVTSKSFAPKDLKTHVIVSVQKDCSIVIPSALRDHEYGQSSVVVSVQKDCATAISSALNDHAYGQSSIHPNSVAITKSSKSTEDHMPGDLVQSKSAAQKEQASGKILAQKDHSTIKCAAQKVQRSGQISAQKDHSTIKCATQVIKSAAQKVQPSGPLSAQIEHSTIKSPHVHKTVVSSSESHRYNINMLVQKKQCWVCGKRAEEWSDLLKHVSEEHTDLLPPIGQIVQQDETSRPSFAQEKETSDQSPAQKDKINTRSQSSPQKHVGFEHRFKCDLCTDTFDKTENLNTHLQLKHRVHRSLKDTTCKCLLCDFRFCDWNFLLAHMKKMHTHAEVLKMQPNNSEKCDLCNESFLDVRQLKNHLKVKHSVLKSLNRIKCLACDLEFSNWQDLLAHVKEKTHREKMLIKCEICADIFTHTAQLYLHLEFKHSVLKSLTSNKFTCLACYLQFRNWQALLWHMKEKRHTENILFKCDICAEPFPDVQQLKNHLQVQHRVLKSLNSIKCLACYLEFSNWQDLLAHMKAKPHNENMPFKCDICADIFTHSAQLNVHLEFKHRVLTSPTSNECLACDLEFSNWQSLLAHIKETTHIENMPLKCYICADIFTNTAQLNLHFEFKHGVLKCPTGMKCIVCKMEFSNLPALLMHMEETNHTEEIGHLQPKPKGLILKCNLCPVQSASYNDLQRHYTSQHGVLWSKTQNKCLKCNLDFKWQKQALIDHMKQNHLVYQVQIQRTKVDNEKPFAIQNKMPEGCIPTSINSHAKLKHSLWSSVSNVHEGSKTNITNVSKVIHDTEKHGELLTNRAMVQKGKLANQLIAQKDQTTIIFQIQEDQTTSHSSGQKEQATSHSSAQKDQVSGQSSAWTTEKCPPSQVPFPVQIYKHSLETDQIFNTPPDKN